MSYFQRSPVRNVAAVAPLSIVAASAVAVGVGALVVTSRSDAFVAIAAAGLLLLVYLGRVGTLAAIAVGATMLSGFVVSRGLIPASRWSTLTALIVLLCAAATLPQRARLAPEPRLAVRLPTILLTVFLALAFVFAGLAVFAGDSHRAWLGARSWCFLPVMFFVGRRIAAERRALSSAVVGVGAGAVLVLAYGYKQFLLGYTPSELALINTSANSVFYKGVPRLSSTLPTNQDLAALLIVLLPAAMAFAAFARTGRIRRWVYLGIPIAASGIAVLGMVRSAAIAAAAGTLVVIGIATRKRQRRAVALVLSLLLAAFVVQIAIASSGTQGSAVRSRVASLTKLAQDPALNARLRVEWPLVIHAIEQQPFGHGIATTGGPAIKLYGASAVIPDNGYLTLGYELGVPGALIYVAFLITCAAAAVRAARLQPEGSLERATAVAAVGASVGVLVAMLGASYVQLPTLQILLFTLLGAAVKLSEQR